MLSTFYDGIEYRFFNHIYAVSRCGKFLRKLKPCQPTKHHQGYLQVSRNLAHRMVATCWCERPEGAQHVHHINGNKQDNRAENLEWLSAKQHFSERHADIPRGVFMTDDGRARLRQLRLGSKTTDATKQKQREAAIRLGCKPPPRRAGTKMGADFKAKCRERSPNARACVIDGVRYASFNVAGEALGAKPHTLRKRCLSPNFPSYQLAEGSI